MSWSKTTFFHIAITKKRNNKEISNNNNYTTDNLLGYNYFSKRYKLIAEDLSKQTEFEKYDLRQQIIFIGKLERNDGAKMFFIIEKTKETTFNFSQTLGSIAWNGNSKICKFIKWFE